MHRTPALVGSTINLHFTKPPPTKSIPVACDSRSQSPPVVRIPPWRYAPPSLCLEPCPVLRMDGSLTAQPVTLRQFIACCLERGVPSWLRPAECAGYECGHACTLGAR